MFIVIGIIFLIVGAIMLLFPTVVYELVHSWKPYMPDEPGRLLIVSVRFGGACFAVVGILEMCLTWLN